MSAPDAEGGTPATVDLLISGGTAVTMDDAGTVVPDAALAVLGGRIVWIGPSPQAVGRFDARRTIDAGGHFVLPGVVDTHFHTGQQLLRGKLAQLARQRRLKIPIWRNYLIPFETALTEEDVHLSGLVGYGNMLRVGTTCFAEAGGPHPDQMGRAAREIGIRGIIARSTVDNPDGLPDGAFLTTAQAIEENLRLVKGWGVPSEENRVGAWLSLRQLLVSSPELWDTFADASKETGARIHIHLAEGTYEIDYAAEQWGLRPTEHLDATGFLGPGVHAAHSILLTDTELELYRDHRVSVAHCPMGNFLIGPPKIPQMFRLGIEVGLGTDGGSTGSLDLLQAIRPSWVALQSHQGTPWHARGEPSLETLLRAATIGGARALGLGDWTGSLEVGKRADVILADSTTWDLQPITDVMFTVARSVTGRDVDTVVVDGQVVVEDRRLLHVDEERLRARLAERLPVIMRRFETLIGA
jgi:5-methylthioadenosine/S-adenosylhomocysteine deaminase